MKNLASATDYLKGQSLEDFGNELEALYNDLKNQVGNEDLAKIKDLHQASWRMHNVGRALIHISADPLTFIVGVLLLSGHYVMEFTNGHNVMHGHYDDIPGNGQFNSKDWQWNSTMPETTWKFEHHVSHHPFTNIMGKDHDYGYLLYRMHTEQEWQPRHLGQLAGLVAMPMIMNLYMPWYISTARALVEDREVLTWQTYGDGIKRVMKKFATNYLFYPLLAGPGFLKVAAGNALANLLSGAHITFMLAIEHHDANLQLIEAKDNESRAEFYLRQILATRNYHLPGWYEDLFTGSVNIHIEHHLWPDLPFNRLKEASPRVEAICRKYGVPYHYDSFAESFWGLFNMVAQQSIPTRGAEGFSQLIVEPLELAKRIFTGAVDSWLPLLKSDLGKEATFVKSRIFKKEKLNEEAVFLEIAMPPAWQKKEYRGGQYISLQLRIGGRDYVRQYSLVNTKAQSKNLCITVKRVQDGLVSNFIHDKVKQGEQITLVGSIKGDFVLQPAKKKRRLFIAGGVGITPILGMLQEMAANSDDTESLLLYFNRNQELAIYNDSLQALAKKLKKFTVKNFYTQQAGIQSQRLSKELLLQQAGDLANTDVYLCAPEKFIEDAREILQACNFDMANLYLESFRPASLPVHTGSANISHTIKFLQSNKEIKINEHTSLLEAIERAGIEIPSGCRQGLCKACLVRKESGHTSLEEGKRSKKNENMITTCNSMPRSDIQLWV